MNLAAAGGAAFKDVERLFLLKSYELLSTRGCLRLVNWLR